MVHPGQSSALSDKPETMLIDRTLEDLNFTFDFWEYLRPHLYEGFSGYGSAGEVHVFRFRRPESGGILHVVFLAQKVGPEGQIKRRRPILLYTSAISALAVQC